MPNSTGKSRSIFIIALAFVITVAVACVPVAQTGAPTLLPRPETTIALTADGETRQIVTSAETIGQALESAGIVIGQADEVSPPPATALDLSGDGSPIAVTIVRVTETSEIIPESIPFQRRIVRSADMSPDDPPRLLQAGEPGFQEVTVRIVYRDGLEAERWPTAITVVEPPKDEIIMYGVSVRSDAMPLSGQLAYIDDGRAILLSGSTDSPRQIMIDGSLDGRVFQLSPDGRYLLFTVKPDGDREGFANQLWFTATAEGSQPQPLQIENVLWAGWDPAAIETPRIAYTTARTVSLPPGWEAINDLWLLTLPTDGSQAAPLRIIETYPATLGWWGGAYAWSPDGSRLAYAFSDETGIIDMPGNGELPDAQALAAEEPARTVLQSFTAYDTGADWAWVPNLSWSADGRYLSHTAYNDETAAFDLWVTDTQTSETAVLVPGVGIWSAAQWSPISTGPQLAFLRSANSEESIDSGYALWLSDADGTNDQRIFPPEGETGRFARTNQSLAWGPNGDTLAFIFENALHITNVATNELYRSPSDDTVSSHPTWAPYGAAAIR